MFIERFFTVWKFGENCLKMGKFPKRSFCAEKDSLSYIIYVTRAFLFLRKKKRDSSEILHHSLSRGHTHLNSANRQTNTKKKFKKNGSCQNDKQNTRSKKSKVNDEWKKTTVIDPILVFLFPKDYLLSYTRS